jgi:hypothetical protein
MLQGWTNFQTCKNLGSMAPTIVKMALRIFSRCVTIALEPRVKVFLSFIPFTYLPP